MIHKYQNTDWYNSLSFKQKNIINNQENINYLLPESQLITGSYGTGKTIMSLLFLRDYCIKMYDKFATQNDNNETISIMKLAWLGIKFIKHYTIKQMVNDYKFQPNGSEQKTNAYYTLYHKDESIYQSKILIIDDLLVDSLSSQFYNDELDMFYYMLLDYRMENDLITIFTSNQSYSELTCFDNNFMKGATIERLKALIQNNIKTPLSTVSLRY